MNVGELIKALEELPADTPVVIRSAFGADAFDAHDVLEVSLGTAGRGVQPPVAVLTYDAGKPAILRGRVSPGERLAGD